MERDLLDRFGLSHRDRIKPLSKGQKRQVALMLALCHRPELLILDEPAGGLDPAARREFLEASIQFTLNREGSAILFSSHHMGDIERIGARVMLLDEGTIRLDCELDRVREDLCVAMVPKAWMEASALEKTPGCLRVRPVFDDWHAVFQGAPDSVQEQLRGPLGSRGIQCVRVPLEELFVELVGGKTAKEGVIWKLIRYSPAYWRIVGWASLIYAAVWLFISQSNDKRSHQRSFHALHGLYGRSRAGAGGCVSMYLL